MRVLVISTNRLKIPYPVIPIGACIVAENIRALGHDVKFLDLMFTPRPVYRLKREIRRFKPRLVALSIRNLERIDLHRPDGFIPAAREYIRIIREMSSARIVVGGSGASLMPEDVLFHTSADLVLQGPWSPVMAERMLDMSRLGCAVSEPGQVRSVPETPDYSHWINLREYRNHLSPVPIQTKLGCPFDCIYCTYPILEGREYLLRTPGKVIEDLERFARFGTTDVEFVDNVFNSPPDHAREICRAIEESGLPLRFSTTDLNPQFIDDHLLAQMEAAGFTGIGISADSASDPVLRSLQKNYSRRHLEQVADAISRQTIPCCWMFLLGGPGETRDTIRETIEFACHCIRPSDPVFFSVGIRVYPGTPIHSHTCRGDDRDDPAVPEGFFLSADVSESMIQSELRIASEKQYNFFDSDSLALPMIPILQRTLGLIGADPPFWRHAIPIRRFFRRIGIKI